MTTKINCMRQLFHLGLICSPWAIPRWRENVTEAANEHKNTKNTLSSKVSALQIALAQPQSVGKGVQWASFIDTHQDLVTINLMVSLPHSTSNTLKGRFHLC